jgi:hypothetical protein
VTHAPEGESLSLSWWQRHRPRWRYSVIGAVDAADLVPDRLPKKVLVVVEKARRPVWVAFDCPCTRQHRLLIPLSAGVTPHWTLNVDSAPTIYPSVDSHHAGHRCHFWLKNGRIQWAGRAPTRRRAVR